MESDTIDPRRDPALAAARMRLADSRRRTRADIPVLASADRLLAELRAERASNHWAERVEAAFRETRGTT